MDSAPPAGHLRDCHVILPVPNAPRLGTKEKRQVGDSVGDPIGHRSVGLPAQPAAPARRFLLGDGQVSVVPKVGNFN